MSLPDDWIDADFEPRERPVGSVEELRTSLVERTARGERDAWFVEDLRLFICVRLLQGRTLPDIEGELVSWGLESDYVVDQISHTRIANSIDFGDGVQTTRYKGAAVAT